MNRYLCWRPHNGFDYGSVRIIYNGLIKITDKYCNILDYKVYNPIHGFIVNNELNKTDTKHFRIMLERDKLLLLFNKLGDEGLLSLGTNKDIQMILENLGWIDYPI